MNTQIVAEPTGSKLICRVVSDSIDVGFLTIDTQVGGRAGGGVRMTPDVDEDEVSDLARVMTLKYGFLGLPVGGAKAGIRCASEAPGGERMRKLDLFASAIGPLLKAGMFVPGPDMGTDSADIRRLLQTAGVPVFPRDATDVATGYYTALTVFAGVKAAASRRHLQLANCSVAIEGFGKVGQAIADLLIESGARIVAVSTVKGALFDPTGLDIRTLKALAAKAGSQLVEHYDRAERIPAPALLELPVDLLCLCAGRHSVTSDNADRIDAGIIVPGANAPVSTEAERVLCERGALLLPDFVTNCGGVLGASLEFAAVDRERIEAFIETRIGPRIAGILDQSERQGLAPTEVATPQALSVVGRMKALAERRSLRSKINGVGLAIYRRGWLPASPVRTRLLAMLENSVPTGSDRSTA